MKKGIKVISAAFSMAVLLSSCYIQKETEQVKTITVTGTGTVSDAPDAASVEFSIVNLSYFIVLNFLCIDCNILFLEFLCLRFCNMLTSMIILNPFQFFIGMKVRIFEVRTMRFVNQ